MITSCASIKYPATPVSVMTILGILVEYTSCASTTPTRGHILVNTSCASIKYRSQYVDPLLALTIKGFLSECFGLYFNIIWSTNAFKNNYLATGLHTYFKT